MFSEVMLNGYTVQGTLGWFEICVFLACTDTVNHAVSMVGIGACGSFQRITEGPLLTEKGFKVCKSFKQIKYKIYSIKKNLYLYTTI